MWGARFLISLLSGFIFLKILAGNDKLQNSASVSSSFTYFRVLLLYERTGTV